MKKNKKIILGISFVLTIFFILIANNTYTAEAANIPFTPNTPIPGYENFFGNSMNIDPSSIGNYINTIYSYAARIASLLAMLMIVLAAWQWLFAAGSPEKINKAKETITGALIGLALLFSGHLLLSQISTGLVELKTINPTPLTGIHLCDSVTALSTKCGDIFKVDGPPNSDGNQTTINCVGFKCDTIGEYCVKETYIAAPYGQAGFDTVYLDCSNLHELEKCSCKDICKNISSCSGYNSVSACQNNICFDRNGFTDVCGTEIGSSICTKLNGINCGSNNEICRLYDIDNDELDATDYCCDSVRIDECRTAYHPDSQNNLNTKCIGGAYDN